MPRAARIAVGSLLMLLPDLSSAACDLTEFDESSPSAFRDVVQDTAAQFEWGSDADEISGRARIWNFIANRGSLDLAASWQKAGIEIPFGNPLPPSEILCNRYFVQELPTDPDFDAPIIYNADGRSQRAAAFVDPGGPSAAPVEQSLTSIIQTAFLGISASPQDVSFTLNSSIADGSVILEFNIQPSDLTFGISSLSELSNEQLTEMQQSLSEPVFITSANIASFDPTFDVGTEYANVALAEVSFLFFSGSKTGSFKAVLPADETIQENAHVVILDEGGSMLAAGFASVFLPTR